MGSVDPAELINGSVIKFYHEGVFNQPLLFIFEIDYISLAQKYEIDTTQLTALTSLSLLSLPNFAQNQINDDDDPDNLNHFINKIWEDPKFGKGMGDERIQMFRDVECMEEVCVESNYGKRIVKLVEKGVVDRESRIFESTKVQIQEI